MSELIRADGALLLPDHVRAEREQAQAAELQKLVNASKALDRLRVGRRFVVGDLQYAVVQAEPDQDAGEVLTIVPVGLTPRGRKILRKLLREAAHGKA